MGSQHVSEPSVHTQHPQTPPQYTRTESRGRDQGGSLGKWYSIYEVLIYAPKKRDGKATQLSKVGTTITASWVSFARTLRSFARALRGDAPPLQLLDILLRVQLVLQYGGLDSVKKKRKSVGGVCKRRENGCTFAVSKYTGSGLWNMPRTIRTQVDTRSFIFRTQMAC